MENPVINLTIPGKPLAKARVRFSRRGSMVVAFDPQKQHHDALKWLLREKLTGFVPISKPIAVELDFYMPVTKTSKKKTNMMLNGEIQHTKKPDLDNMIKYILDCMNGIVFEDDKQVVSIKGRKMFGADPRTEIKVRCI